MEDVGIAVEALRRRNEARYELALWQSYHTASFVLDALWHVESGGKSKFPEWKSVISRFRQSMKNDGKADEQVPKWIGLKQGLGAGLRGTNQPKQVVKRKRRAT